MAEVQTTYTDSIAVGYAGMVANGGNGDRIPRTIESSGGIGFGKVAYRGAGDHGIVATRTLVAAGSEPVSGNTGNGTITDAPTVALGAKPGRYIALIVEPASNAGSFVLYDPNGVVVGEGTVAVEATIDGLTFTIADGGTDFASGDRLFIDVSGGEAVGITIAHQALGLLTGETADRYQQYDTVAVLCGGEPIWVEAGGTVGDGQAVQVDADGNFVASGGEPVPGWKFDTSGVDGDLVKIVKR